MEGSSRQLRLWNAPLILTASAFAALLCGTAGAQCTVTCPSGSVVAGDGCDDPDDAVNGGCNLDAPSFDELGNLAPGSPITYCGEVGTFGDGQRDLDWARFTLAQPAVITVSVNHIVGATGEPAPNITVFVLEGDDCETNEIVLGVAGANCPFENSVTLPAGSHLVAITVNAFGPDLPACPVDFVATVSAAFGAFPQCGLPDAGDCGEPHGTGGCDDFGCCETVCAFNPICCDIEWDASCVDLAIQFCGIFLYECEDVGGPANDCFPDAAEVTAPSTVPFDSSNANTDGPDHAECNSAEGDLPIHKDLWYYWVADRSGSFTATTCLLTEFDTKIAAYNLGTSLPSEVDPQTLPQLFIGCNEDCDDPTFFSSELTFSVEAGNVYAIRVGGYQGAGGPGVIEFAIAGFPPPDTCNDGGDDTLTQSNDPVATAGQIACAGGGITTENNFARSFDLSVGGTAGNSYRLDCVDFGFSNSGNDLIGSVNVYVDTNGGEPQAPGIDLELVGSRAVTLPSGFIGNLIASFEPAIVLEADSVVVIEINVPASDTGFAVVAGNPAGDTAPTYIRAAACGINEYATYDSIGFPDANWALTLIGEIGGGKTSCPTDLDGNGIVDGGDLGLVLAAYNNPGGPEDIDGNGIVDGGDLGLVLADFNTECP